MEGEVLPPYTDEEKELARAALSEVKTLMQRVRRSELELESNYVRLGKALYEVQRHQYWMVEGFKSWNVYLNSLNADVRRTQLYHYSGVAKDLLPVISEADLVQIGISKAAVLRKILKTGRVPSPELVEKAKTGTLADLRSDVAQVTHEPNDDPGSWFDLGAIKLTEEELEEFNRTADLAARTDPPATDHAVTNWADEPWQIRKEILWRWGAEFWSAHEPGLEEQRVDDAMDAAAKAAFGY